MSKKFNERGLRTEVLTGEDTQERRESVIARLTNDEDGEDQLDYNFYRRQFLMKVSISRKSIRLLC